VTISPAPAVASGAAFWADLRAHGDAPALVTDAGAVGYAELADRVDDMAVRLGAGRRLVLLAARNDVDTVAAYLACLRQGHPVVVASAEHAPALATLTAAYEPDLVVRGSRVEDRRGPQPAASAHDLHPDLAVLLSTSGSTGSPKLVRLSHTNLRSNAAAIAAYLGIRPTDVAALTLPLHYCYGLSVLHSHLHRGAAVLLTERSVSEPEFWQRFRAAGATTLPGVPYTFDLLDRAGFADLDLPTLRYLTQAGGRMDPDTVRRYAELGRRRGWDLVVMYGATEATARMAYLPADLALVAPETVGVAIPGGTLRIDPLDAGGEPRGGADGGVGELVYAGDNVMLGYAVSPADLSRGGGPAELRTGDLARIRADGLCEIVGRRSRVAKVFGLRVDLSRVERVLGDAGVVATCAEGDGRVVVAVDVSAGPVDRAAVEAVLSGALGLPGPAVEVVAVPAVPRLETGKPDYAAVAALGARAAPPEGLVGRPAADADERAVRAAYAEVLGRPDVSPGDSFVSLRGDSLSYVELSLRLERLLGPLPPSWPSVSVRDLAGTAPSRRAVVRWGRRVETTVAMRAVGIVLVVGSHANLWVLLGSAHVLLAVAGFNTGRFHLTDQPRKERVRHLAASVARLAVPAAVWLALLAPLTAEVTWRNAVLLNGVLGPRQWDDLSWHYWYVEAIVATLLAVLALVAWPAFDRLERRSPFWLPMLLALLALLTRYDVVRLLDGDEIHRAHVVAWLFLLGWAAVRAATSWQRALVTVVTVATVPGFFEDDLGRDLTVLAGLLLLVWVPYLRLPAWSVRPLGVLAGASFYIYLCHWRVYPMLEDSYPLAATVLSLAAGVGFAWLVARLSQPLAGMARSGMGHTLGWLSLRRCPTRDEPDPSTPRRGPLAGGSRAEP
jgi:acyl-CoA synthetase (AMP-forming)/AMP-acid ligase II